MVTMNPKAPDRLSTVWRIKGIAAPGPLFFCPLAIQRFLKPQERFRVRWKHRTARKSRQTKTPERFRVRWKHRTARKSRQTKTPERFRVRWKHRTARKSRQTKTPDLAFDSIKSEKVYGSAGFQRLSLRRGRPNDSAARQAPPRPACRCCAGRRAHRRASSAPSPSDQAPGMRPIRSLSPPRRHR